MGGYFDLASKDEEIKELQKNTENATFWDNPTKAEEVLIRLNTLMIIGILKLVRILKYCIQKL